MTFWSGFGIGLGLSIGLSFLVLLIFHIIVTVVDKLDQLKTNKVPEPSDN